MKNDDLKCAGVREQLALLLYGELSFDQEERLESHLDSCADCRESLVREKAAHAALDAIEVLPSPSLLRECREDLRARLMHEEMAPLPAAKSGWWDRFVDALTLRPVIGVLRPVGALTLIALGFGAARMLPDLGSGMGLRSMGLGELGAAHVRHVEPAANGTVQIVFDETRQRIVSGQLDDQKIRALLLSAAKDPSNPGLRGDTVNLLVGRAESAEVRDALILALRDTNSGVRMKALDGLKPYVNDAEVRTAVTRYC